jgi:CBS domain-containing protein
VADNLSQGCDSPAARDCIREEVRTKQEIVRSVRRGVVSMQLPPMCLVVGALQESAWKWLMQVREIMTAPPVTCTPGTSLGVAAGRMAESNCGILPVVDADGRLAGIITDRDICIAVSRTNRNAINISVREVMTRKVLSLHLGDDVRRALACRRARCRGTRFVLPSCDDALARHRSAVRGDHTLSIGSAATPVWACGLPVGIL